MCGVVAVIGIDEAATIALEGMRALQHRGQGSCGLAVFDADGVLRMRRKSGTVNDRFSEDQIPNITAAFPGTIATGHLRYATTGKQRHDDEKQNLTPLKVQTKSFGNVVYAHNGTLTNAATTRDEIEARGTIIAGTSDTWVIPHLMALAFKRDIKERFIDALKAIEGGYALAVMTKDKVLLARDPNGLRPLSLGWIDKAGRRGAVVASETAALRAMGATFERDIKPGEVVVLSLDGSGKVTIDEGTFPLAPRRVMPCVFEYVYFARPDSVINGIAVSEARYRMGERLAQEETAGFTADVVSPLLDSGADAAQGYAHTMGIPYRHGIIRNHHAGRSFIEAGQKKRRKTVEQKHSPNRAVLEGQRVTLVDDSIVRGNTSAKIVQMVRDAGAAEVHFRVASPPVKAPDFFGIDMPSRNEFIANEYGSLEEMRKALGVDSLNFLTLKGLHEAIEPSVPFDPAKRHFADHVFSDDYSGLPPLVDQREELERAAAERRAGSDALELR